MKNPIKSRIWLSDPQREFDHPYDYDEQGLFLQEAESLLVEVLELLQKNNMRFTTDDRSAEKAIWMLHIDALDALRETAALLREKRHSIAGRLFRDVLETIDLAAHFARETLQSKADLEKWYNDEIVPHRRSRASIAQKWGAAAEGARRAQYQNWSRFTHRSYWAVKQSFGRGREDRIWHDSVLRAHGQCIPQIVASYLPILGDLAILLIIELSLHSSLAENERFSLVLARIPPSLLVLVGSNYLPVRAPATAVDG